MKITKKGFYKLEDIADVLTSSVYVTPPPKTKKECKTMSNDFSRLLKIFKEKNNISN